MRWLSIVLMAVIVTAMMFQVAGLRADIDRQGVALSALYARVDSLEAVVREGE